MSRGRKRNRRKTHDVTIPKATPGKESARSKAYTAGKTVRYAYRINGPQFPVVTTTIDTTATTQATTPARRRAFG